DDESVSNVKADKIYSGILSNSNESLRLFNPNCSLVDEVVANPSWPFGDSSSRKTMERKADFNWQTTSIVNGTPRAENSAEQVIYSSGGGGGGGSTYTPTIVETITYCSQENLVSPTHQGIIINEIAWMGDSESSSNEWIELRNISEEDVSLHNWQLLSLDNKIKIVFDENDLILKGGYYLLERTDDNSVLNVSANKIYSGALSNNDESLRLFDSSCSLIDEVIANPDWEKGNNEDKNTMQRNDDLTWGESQGSPGENNSIPIVEETVNSLLVISEIQTSGQEYVELFNQGSENIDLCPDEDNCYYLSYYPLSLDEEGNQKYSWDNPYYHWKFPQDSVIPQGGYYLINIFGSFDADMIALTKEGKPYSSQIVTDGSFAISKGGEKIDAVGVRIGEIDPIVKEGTATNIISNEKKSLGRKWVDQKYKDTDNNFEDFELQNPSPGEYSNQIPPKIENINISLEDNYRNSLVLSWNTPEDIDSDLEEIEYKIYYSLNQNIDENNLVEFSDYNSFEVIKEEGINKAILRNLYYNKEYYFAIKSFDKEGNESLLSNQFSFSTPAPNHQISVINGNSQNNNLFDYIGLNGEWSQESLNLIIESNYDAIILMSPALIDDSGIVYMSQSFGGGHRSVKAFRENNEVLWSYNCDNNCNLTSLSDDGTIYIIDTYSIKALTPSGKLKWRKDGLEEINGLSSVDSQGRFYFISGKKVYAAEDKGSEVQVDQVFESGTGINNIVIDKNDNIYLSSENLLIKAKFGLGKIGEYAFSSEKSEDYIGEISGKPYIYKINLTSNNEVIVNLRNYYYETANTLPMTCLFQENLGEPIWSKVGYKEPLAIGESQMFFWRYENYKMRLYGIDLSNGEVSWYKEWDTHGYALPINYIVSDKSNNVYFLLGSKLIGYNTNNITSNNPEEDVIAQISLGISSYAISPGKNKLIFSYQKKITSLSY
ncbi:MAG: lamin tail domain-containing protein, partial [Bacteroidales bacterium]